MDGAGNPAGHQDAFLLEKKRMVSWLMGRLMGTGVTPEKLSWEKSVGPDEKMFGMLPWDIWTLSQSGLWSTDVGDGRGYSDRRGRL